MAQETFLIAFQQRARFRALRSDLRPWLFGIATNLIRQRRREEARFLELLAGKAVEESTDPDEEELIERLDAARLRPDLARALGCLSLRDREVLALKIGADLTNKEIAAALGVSRAAIAVRLHRIRRRLRSALLATGLSSLAVAESAEGSGWTS